MTAENTNVQTRWTEVGGFRSHYYAPKARVANRVVARRKIIWERVLLPFLAFACYSAYQSNAAVEQQYDNDSHTVYSALLNR
jgi:hypothetical protein